MRRESPKFDHGAAAQQRVAALERRLQALESLVMEMLLDSPPGTAPGPDGAEFELRRIVAEVGDLRFGLPLGEVREVVRIVALQPLPEPRPAFLGRLDLRGQLVDVIDLRVAVGLPPLEDDLDARLVIIEFEERVFALKVDGVSRSLALTKEQICPPPSLASARYLSGVTKCSVDDGAALLLLAPRRLLAIVEAGESAEWQPEGES